MSNAGRRASLQPTRLGQFVDMDTVHEETYSETTTPIKECASPGLDGHTYNETEHREGDRYAQTPLLCLPPVADTSQCGRQLIDTNDDASRLGCSGQRRQSAIFNVLRRPSQAISHATAQAIANQKKMWSEFLQRSRTSLAGNGDICKEGEHEKKPKDSKKMSGDDALATALSALYAKLLVVLGVAFPITEIISLKVPASFYQGFYLYLYSLSVTFVIFMYATLVKEKAVYNAIDYIDSREKPGTVLPQKKQNVSFGSFYLRLGAIAFGIGSMVYSGLEFGQYFELKKDPRCQNVMLALTPAIRMLLTLLQMQFIFMNSREMSMNRYKMVARFGMMHLIATNLCEWLYVLVAETKHEIMHLEHVFDNEHEAADNLSSDQNETTINNMNMSSAAVYNCRRTNIMGSLVQNASPFLFPCTIEYSLICAVIVFEMWKKIKVVPTQKKILTRTGSGKNEPHFTKQAGRHNSIAEKIALNLGVAGLLRTGHRRSQHHFSLDCSNAHQGLFVGILIIVITIISLIIFFVLSKDPDLVSLGIFEVNICELILYTISTAATIIATIQIRHLTYIKQKTGVLGLDTTLLIVAQAGMFIYCMFSIIGSFFTISDPEGTGVTGFLSELFSLIQTIVQTMFILDAWWRRTTSGYLARHHPGRQIVTFLLVANMAMWTINTLERNRAEFRPTHLKFFGFWAWTIITHVSMPLAIFYRFHSTICLFEIWKTSYKWKPDIMNMITSPLSNALEP